MIRIQKCEATEIWQQQSGHKLTYFITSPEKTIAIDPHNIDDIETYLGRTNTSLSYVFFTHYDKEQKALVKALKQKYESLIVIVPEGVEANETDEVVGDAEELVVEGLEILVMHTPGHTQHHNSYYLPALGVVFTGGIYQVYGCGEVGEKNAPEELYDSLEKIAQLPASTLLLPDFDAAKINMPELEQKTFASIAEELSVNPAFKPLDQFLEYIDSRCTVKEKVEDAS